MTHSSHHRSPELLLFVGLALLFSLVTSGTLYFLWSPPKKNYLSQAPVICIRALELEVSATRLFSPNPSRDRTCRHLIVDLSSASAELREAAADRLAVKACLPEEAVFALVPLLQDEEVNVRWAAQRALMSYGPQAAYAIPALVEALSHLDTKDWAPLVLIHIGQPAVHSVSLALEHPRAHVRRSAAHVLGSIGTEASPAAPALYRVARSDKSWLVRRTATWALTSIRSDITGSPNRGPCWCDDAYEVCYCLPELMKALADDPANERWVTAPLTRIGKDAVPPLRRALKDPRVHVRRAAAFALGAMDADFDLAAPDLRRLARSDPNPSVRSAAARALDSIRCSQDQGPDLD